MGRVALPTGVLLPSSLDQARVTRLPATVYYIADFISEEEERLILDKVRYVATPSLVTHTLGSPTGKLTVNKISGAPKPKWKQLSHRRLQTWPSDLVQDRLLDSPLPPWLEQPIVSRLLSIPLAADDSPAHLFASSPHMRPNHVLINEYPPGVGIMPHKDGSAYHPVVCTVSLGASLCLNIHSSKEDGALNPEPAYRILQEPRSLLITTDDLYTQYLHGIADVQADIGLSPETVSNWDMLRAPEDFANGDNQRSTRTSLTYRDVLKVSKLGNNVGKFLKR